MSSLANIGSRLGGLGPGGIPRTQNNPTQETTTVTIEVPLARKPDRFIRGYPIGDLIFWDRNLDGRFRWRDLDFITDHQARRILPGSKKISSTLKPLGLKRAFELKNLFSMMAKHHSISTPSLAPKKTKAENKIPEDSSEVLEDHLMDLEIAMEMGDFKGLTAELQEIKVLLLPRGLSLPPALILKLKDITRMNYHFREAADLLDQGLPEMAAREVKQALDFAKRLGIQLSNTDISIEIRSVPPFEISEAQIMDLMRFLTPGLKND